MPKISKLRVYFISIRYKNTHRIEHNSIKILTNAAFLWIFGVDLWMFWVNFLNFLAVILKNLRDLSNYLIYKYKNEVFLLRTTTAY